jgi:hypothetical protein
MATNRRGVVARRLPTPRPQLAGLGACLLVPVIAVAYTVVAWASTGGTAAGAAMEAMGFGALFALIGPCSVIGWLWRWLLLALAAAGLARLVALHSTGALVGGLSTGWIGLVFLAFALVVVARNVVPGPDAGSGGSSLRLASPFASGTFIVGQGGRGRAVNHHAGSVPQCFALDICGARALGPRTKGWLAHVLDDYLIWGTPVVSPLSGRVVEACDGLDDLGATTPPEGNWVAIEPEERPGWRVVVAHLMQGSVAVTTGDRVGAGQPLGLVGNSGNSTEPHLHLHVQDADGIGVPLSIGGRGRPCVRNDLVRGGRLP